MPETFDELLELLDLEELDLDLYRGFSPPGDVGRERVFGGQVAAQAGGGIVADSDPAAEYDESMDKVWALLQSLDPGEQIREQVR